MKQQQQTVRANMLFTLAALLVVLMSNVYVGRAQTNELPDTVWTKFTYPYAINAVKFTPDGRFLASGCDDGVPRLWDAETGELVFEYPQTGYKILDLDCINNLIAIASPVDGGVYVYDVDNKSLINTFEPSTNVCFNKDGSLLATTRGKSVHTSGISVYNTISGELINRIDIIKGAYDLKISKDDKYIIRSSNWGDASTENKEGIIEIFTFPELNYLGYIEKKEYLSCNNLDFSQDNLQLAGALTAEPNKIWNTSDWKLKSEIGKDAISVAFSPESKYILYGEGGYFNWRINIYSTSDNANVYSYKLDWLLKKYLNIDKGDAANSIDINDSLNKIAIGTNIGIYMLNAKWNPTSVLEESIQILEPEIFPNPNNGKAIIRFNLLKNTEVSVDIYDINSRLISNIFKGQLNIGLQTFEWLAKVPNGIYFARISSGTSVSSIKIIVQR